MVEKNLTKIENCLIQLTQTTLIIEGSGFNPIGEETMSKMLIVNDNQGPPHLPSNMEINKTTNEKQGFDLVNQSVNSINMSCDVFNDNLDNLRTMTGNINPSNVYLVSILMNLDNQSPMINVTSDYCSFSYK